jgi:hypothetical protein
VVKIKVYVEGGGEGKNLSTECRRGFNKIFSKVIPNGIRPRIVAGGPRENTIKMFLKAVKSSKEQKSILLVDSEGPVPEKTKPWEYLKNGHNWTLDSPEDRNRVFLMVQLMEAWFLADKQTLQSYFGRGFSVNPLPQRQNIEEIPLKDVNTGLRNATRNSAKGEYGKALHSYEILGMIDPSKVEKASDHAAQLFEELRRICLR